MWGDLFPHKLVLKTARRLTRSLRQSTVPLPAVLPRPLLLGAMLLGSVLLGVGLAGCGGNSGSVEVLDDSGEPWVLRGSACVRESEEGPMRRVINRVDPELCGRRVKTRSEVYVRVLPPPGMRSR